MMYLTILALYTFPVTALKLNHHQDRDDPELSKTDSDAESDLYNALKVEEYEKQSSHVFRNANVQIAKDDLEDGVLAFFPGATRKRMDIVKNSVAWLQSQNIPLECIIYNYDSEPLSEDLKPCKVVDHKGQWMDHFTQVPLNMTKKKYILHLMDGVEPIHVDLRRMMNAMAGNNLSHAAPAMYGIRGYQQNAPHLGFGRFVNFIEMHMDLYHRDNFACLQDILDTKNGKYASNHGGLGVDVAMPTLCKGQMGVMDVMKALKKTSGSYDRGAAKSDMRSWLSSHGLGGAKPPRKNPGPPLGTLDGQVLPDDPQCDISTFFAKSEDDCLMKDLQK